MNLTENRPLSPNLYQAVHYGEKMKVIDKKDIVFKFKKSYNIVYNEKYICCLGECVNLYNSDSGEFIKSIEEIHSPNFSRFTSDGKLVSQTTKGEYFIYDLKSEAILRKISPPDGVLGSITDFAITPDNRFIIGFAHISMKYKLMLIEIETGEKILFDLDNARSCQLFHNTSKTEFYIAIKRAPDSTRSSLCPLDFYLLKYPFEKFNLTKMEIGKVECKSIIDFNDGKIVMVESDTRSSVLYSENTVIIYDIYNQKKESFAYQRDGYLHSLKLSKDCKYLAVGESREVSVFDVVEKKCIKAFDVDYGCFADFFGDNAKLLVGTWEEGYCLKII